MTTVVSIYAVAVPSTALLFFFRLRAIYDKNLLVVLFFFVVWLSVVGGSLTLITAVAAENIGPTVYCVQSGLKSYAASAPITSLIHDTLVFCAISWRLMMNTHVENNISKLAKGFMSGSSLPQFSRALLQDGQMYYLCESRF